MHCVLCSTPLTDENQAGIVCQPCKQTQQGKRNEREQAIRVRFCAGCGRPYQPADRSIQHFSCLAEERQEQAFA